MTDMINLLMALFYIAAIGAAIFIVFGPILEMIFAYLFDDFFDDDGPDAF